ncbi:hypothetical protein AB0M50_02155 [Nonomuraea fuscirosea]|uniref:effector-associated constant component EACC1 n=1 Tax=Nonomuraea fuscirosea TaxID=1291556 RepID=UPI00342EBF23
MDVRIRITGGDAVAELAALWEWLQDEEALHGAVSPVEKEIGQEELGGAVELITVVLSSGGAGLALSRALNTWLRTRRGDVKVTVSDGERTVELEASNVKDVLPLLREVLGDDQSP